MDAAGGLPGWTLVNDHHIVLRTTDLEKNKIRMRV